MFLSFVSLSAAGARAQSEGAIDEGVRLYAEADFEGALTALERAEHETLDRRELLRLLATRALVRFALGDFDRLDRDLLAIVSLEPDYNLGGRAPPPLANALSRARAGAGEPLSVRAFVETTPRGVRVTATTHGDRAGLVDHVEVFARPVSRAAYAHGEPSVELVVAPESEIEVRAVATGPGGAVLATDGTEDAPRRVRAPEPLPTAAPPPDGPSAGVWLGLGLGVAAAAAAGIILALVLGGSNETLPRGPFVDR